MRTDNQDIIAVVGEHVALRRIGGRYIGLCPFHDEMAPSFCVHVGHQFYKCFTCGAGGDAAKFLSEIEKVRIPVVH